MPTLHSSKIISYSADDIYRIVADIEQYPKMLNYIKSVRILAKNENQMTAEVNVGVGLIQFSYECDITLAPPNRIDIVSTKKPFKRLAASWQFFPLSPTSTKVDYALDSQFASGLMERTAGIMLAQQLHYSLSAFESRLRKS
jgi:ribosome-associated toxin RatA of RatAB toxin-antitoxin module